MVSAAPFRQKDIYGHPYDTPTFFMVIGDITPTAAPMVCASLCPPQPTGSRPSEKRLVPKVYANAS
jgi:hypothetical protein